MSMNIPCKEYEHCVFVGQTVSTLANREHWKLFLASSHRNYCQGLVSKVPSSEHIESKKVTSSPANVSPLAFLCSPPATLQRKDFP